MDNCWAWHWVPLNLALTLLAIPVAWRGRLVSPTSRRLRAWIVSCRVGGFHAAVSKETVL